MRSRTATAGIVTSILIAAASPVTTLAQSDSLDVDQLSAVISGAATHTVERGDTLSMIAEEFYGDSTLWPAILDANSIMLGGDVRALQPGMTLDIPSLDTALAGKTSFADDTAYIAPVEETARRKWVYGEGTARAIRREFMSFESAGRVAYVDPNLKEGDYVEAGHVIAYQNPARSSVGVASADASIVQAQSQVAVNQASLDEAQANLKLAQRTFQRYATLLEQNSASQQEYDQAEAQLESARASAARAQRQIEASQADIAVAQANRASAKVDRDEAQLIAPISGIVARLNIEQGDYYSPQYLQVTSEQSVFNFIPAILIDPSRFEIELNVPSNLFDELEIGAPVLISIIDPDATLEERLPDEDAGPPKPESDYEVRGEIYSISPVFDTSLRNFIVKVRTIQGEDRIRDGESVALWMGRGPR